MTADRNNPSNAAQDSDDLIAELARLVAQDARTTSGNSTAYSRAEPVFEPAPEAEQPTHYEPEATVEAPEAETWTDSGYDAVENAPNPFDDEAAYQAGAESVDGFEPTPHYEPMPGQSVAQDDEGDPIAGLIADAEVEAYERDTGDDIASEAEDYPAWDEPQSEPVYGTAFTPMQEPAEPVAHSPDAAYQTNSLSDIEALIGEAVRGDSHVDAGMPGRRVRSSFLDDQTTNDAVDAAESAILAAAAASGSAVGHRANETDAHWADAGQADDAPPATDDFDYGVATPEPREPEPYQTIPDPLFAAAPRQPEPHALDAEDTYEEEDYEDEPRRAPIWASGRLKSILVPVAGGLAILALLGGGYVLFFSGPQAPSEAPVLTADASPIKEEGAPPEDNPNASVVFNEIEGNTAAVEDEALVSRDQTGGATGNEVASVIGVEEGELALANRPVRTVTVRPDGTIVPAGDSVAGATVLPVDRPDVPAVPNSTLTSDPIGAAIAEAMAGESAAPEMAEPETLAVAETGDAAAPIEDVGTGETATAAPQGATGNAPSPIARPSGLGTATAPAAAPAQETVAAAPPAAASTPAATTETAAPAASGSVGAWVQLASQRSESDAQADIAPLQSRYGSLFNGATPEVSRVDLGERGVYYRVRLPQPTFAQANSVCSAIQAQGGDCFVLNN